jgi:Asp-tRNA(Asn)/Glu-tRNA(Gln) amidotransferase A subunit family amidase
MLARTAEDVALIFQHMAGYDPRDAPHGHPRPGLHPLSGLSSKKLNLP